jgi:excisionase family DNA binding protein
VTEQLLTVGEVAARCQVSTKTVYRAIKAGRLRAHQLGEEGAYRTRPEDLEAWLAGAVVRPTPDVGPEPVDAAPAARPAARRRRGGQRGRLAVNEGMGRSG